MKLLIAVLSAAALNAADFFASPTGLASNPGSQSAPWDLATALNHPAAVRPGDTIYLRGGTYDGCYMSRLTGTAVAPIHVRRYQKERAIIDCHRPTAPTLSPGSALMIAGAHAYFWELEFTNSEPRRIWANRECFDNQHCRSSGIDVFGPGVKIINCIIHDTGNGIGLWTPAVGAEAYGNIIYYVGWQSDIRGSGHGIYAQNGDGTKRIANNIVFHGFHSGGHLYGSAASNLRNMTFDLNTVFNNGLLAQDPNGWGLLVGGGVRADTIRVSENNFYNPTTYLRSSNMNPSWGSNGSTNLTITNNVSVGYRSIEMSTVPTESNITGNTFVGIRNEQANSAVSAATNRILATNTLPPVVVVAVNEYDTSKANVTIFNGTGVEAVDLDVSAILQAGDDYRIVDVQDLFGAPVAAGAYNGGTIRLPLTGTALSPIVGTVPRAPVHTDRAFGAFIIERLVRELPPPPPPPPPPTTFPITIQLNITGTCQHASGECTFTATGAGTAVRQ